MTVQSQRAIPAGVIVAAAAVMAILLAAPGRTVTTTYVNDLFIFLDGAHRVVSGQVPNRDFHTALGPVVYYVPAIGYWLSGTLGGAMPVGMAVLLLVLAPIVAHVLTSRMHSVIAVALALFLLVILAAPVNLGESIRSLSFAMYYNRVGWAALAVLLVMYLRPIETRAHHERLDALCATMLTLLTLYSKVTYGLVALAFLVFMLFDRRQRFWAASAIGLTLVGGIVVEAIWRSSLAHLADLMLTSRVSGGRGLEEFAQGFLRHLADYVLYALLTGLALWRSRRVRDVLFFGFCAGPGLLILIQNSQPWGIITLHAGAAVAAEMLWRERRREPLGAAKVAAGSPFLLLAFLLPTTIHCFAALVLHTTVALSGSGQPFGLPGFDRIELARLWSTGDHDFSTAYLASLQDGARALAELPERPRHVSVLDFVSPFSAGLGLQPPKGDNAWLHWGRNVNAAHHVPAEHLLGGVEVLMLPKWGINNIPLRDLYDPYIREAFKPVRETDYWTIHLRRPISAHSTVGSTAGSEGPDARSSLPLASQNGSSP